MRSLPPSFKHFFALSSDCDGLFDTNNAIEMYDLLRDRMQLPIADSVHLDQLRLSQWVIIGTVAHLLDPAEASYAGICRQMPEWLNFAHRGLIDTLHGAISATSVRIGVPADDGAGTADDNSPQGKFPRQFILNGEATQRLSLKFLAMPEWSEGTASRYFVCRIACRDISSQFNVFISTASSVVFSGTFVGRGVFAPELLRIPLTLERLIDETILKSKGKLRQLFELRDGIRVVIDFVPGSGKGVDIFDPGLVSHSSDEVEELGRFAEESNFTLGAFTSHGGGPVFRPDGFLAEAANDDRVLADNPANEIYLTAQLDRLRCHYRNTYQNTSQCEVQSIETLLVKRKDWDGVSFYDFTRYSAFSPSDVERNGRLFTRNSVALNPSLRETLGINIKQLREELGARVDEGTGGLVYTHIFATQAAAPGIDSDFFAKPLNQETINELQSLRDSHYGLNGNVEDRIFVAPQSILLKLSQVTNGLKRANCRLHPAISTIEITSWVDEVSGHKLPDPATKWRDLRLVYFPVDDVDAARVIVDGQDVSNLIRMRTSEVGPAGYVSVCDIATRSPAFGHWISESNANFEVLPKNWRVGLDSIMHTVDASTALCIRPKSLSFTDASGLGLRLAASGPVSVRCAINMKSGLSLVLEVDHTRSQHYVPLWSVANGSVFDTTAEPPFGLVDQVLIEVSGKPATELSLSLDRYRDEEAKYPETKGYFITGRAVGFHPTDTIVASCGSIEDSTAIAASGFFAIPRKWLPMSEVKLSMRRKDGSVSYPSTGRHVLMTTNRSDVVFDSKGNV